MERQKFEASADTYMANVMKTPTLDNAMAALPTDLSGTERAKLYDAGIAHVHRRARNVETSAATYLKVDTLIREDPENFNILPWAGRLSTTDLKSFVKLRASKLANPPKTANVDRARSKAETLFNSFADKVASGLGLSLEGTDEEEVIGYGVFKRRAAAAFSKLYQDKGGKVTEDDMRNTLIDLRVGSETPERPGDIEGSWNGNYWANVEDIGGGRKRKVYRDTIGQTVRVQEYQKFDPRDTKEFRDWKMSFGGSVGFKVEQGVITAFALDNVSQGPLDYFAVEGSYAPTTAHGKTLGTYDPVNKPSTVAWVDQEIARGKLVRHTMDGSIESYTPGYLQDELVTLDTPEGFTYDHKANAMYRESTASEGTSIRAYYSVDGKYMFKARKTKKGSK